MTSLLEDVIEGLSAEDKFLQSKYFYDDTGDLLFQEIMALDEYYLTRAETAIFHENAQSIAKEFPPSPFQLAELGAGDGSKTKYLLAAALKMGLQFIYRPIDISAHVLNILDHNLKKWLPGLISEGMAMDYFEALRALTKRSLEPLVVLFLGSNIGNFRRDNVDAFMSELAGCLRKGDLFILGVDKKKDPNQILAAYNDSRGVTAAFNFNILRRLNRELGANFDLRKFKYYNSYDPHSGESRSYLISLEKQEVHIKVAQKSFTLEAHEAIHTETSRKYGSRDLDRLAQKHGFKIRQEFQDAKQLFRDQIWEKL